MAVKVVARGRSRPALWRSMEKSRPVAENGDSFLVCGALQPVPAVRGVQGRLYAVADGLGGEGNDDVASQTAVGTLRRLFLGEEPLDTAGVDHPDGWLRAAYDQVNQTVCAERKARQLRGMYTTLCAAMIVQEGEGVALFPANIGDSRMYLVRQRRLIPLTRDDGEGGFISRVIGDPQVFNQSYLRYATTVARTEEIEAEVLGALEQTLRDLVTEIAPADTRPLAALFLTILEGVYPAEMAAAYNRSLGILLEGLGQARYREFITSLADAYESVVSRLARMPLQPGDRLLLCSDGISNAFTEAFLLDVLSQEAPAGSIEASLDNMLETLLVTVGRVDDDRTGVVVAIEAG